MDRRKFLVGTATGAVAIAGLTTTGLGQGRQGGRGGRRRGPANVAPEKLARLGMMTLNHSNMIKTPWNDLSPDRTLDVLDIPQYYIDMYGVRDVEFQNSHVAENRDEPDPAFFRELKAKFDAAGSRANQINIEIGVISNLTAEERPAWMARAKKWVDAAPVLGIKRLMLNQSGLNDENKANVISIWKEIQDYATPKGVMISAETRGNGPAGASAPERAKAVWGLLAECAEATGGYTNLDTGGSGRFASQEELHAGIKGLFARTAGSMHIKSSPYYDIAQAVRYTESLGYTGLYTIEVRTDPVVRIVYNTLLAALA